VKQNKIEETDVFGTYQRLTKPAYRSLQFWRGGIRIPVAGA